MTTTTTYTASDERGLSFKTTDPERAERLSRAGLTVKATTGKL